MANTATNICLLLLAVTSNVALSKKNALLMVDVQLCFTPGGTLAITDGDDVISVLNDMRKQYANQFDLIVLSQDWHCVNHISFASQHNGYNPFDVVPLEYDSNGALCKTGNAQRNGSVDCSQVAHRLNQTLWPDHCIMETADAGLHPSLNTNSSADVIVRKGYRCNVDSYSVFYDNGGFTQTELQEVLINAAIDTVFIAGLARDYCVFWTAKDAKKLGYKTYVVLDATKPVNEQTGAAAVEQMKTLGVHLLNSSNLNDVLSTGSVATCWRFATLHLAILVSLLGLM